jgi:hypothetical protein
MVKESQDGEEERRRVGGEVDPGEGRSRPEAGHGTNSSLHSSPMVFEDDRQAIKQTLDALVTALTLSPQEGPGDDD